MPSAKLAPKAQCRGCVGRHCLAPNRTDEPRTMVNVRYAPKWVPVDRLVGETQGQPPWPMMPQEVYEGLPANLQPLYDHATKPPPEPSKEERWDLHGTGPLPGSLVTRT